MKVIKYRPDALKKCQSHVRAPLCALLCAWLCTEVCSRRLSVNLGLSESPL